MFSEGESKPMKEAATVVLTRPGENGLEVFLVKRHSRSGFMAGAYVFPGGKLDEADHGFKEDVLSFNMLVLASRLQQTPGRFCSDSLRLGLVVAACRELFEEAGILFAVTTSGKLITEEDPQWGELMAQRAAVNAGEASFEGLLRKAGLKLCAESLGYWSHWVTPSAEKRRFDTRFFVAALPGGQTAVRDDRETTDARWMTPEDALNEQKEGAIFLPPPTLRTLEDMSRFESHEELMAFASTESPFAVMPKIHTEDNVISIILPWDAEFAGLEGESLEFSATEHPFVQSPSRIVFDGEGWSSIDNRR